MLYTNFKLSKTKLTIMRVVLGKKLSIVQKFLGRFIINFLIFKNTTTVKVDLRWCFCLLYYTLVNFEYNLPIIQIMFYVGSQKLIVELLKHCVTYGKKV